MKITDTIYAYDPVTQKQIHMKLKEVTSIGKNLNTVLASNAASLKEFENPDLPLPFFADLKNRALNVFEMEGTLEEVVDEIYELSLEVFTRIDSNPYKVLANRKLREEAEKTFDAIATCIRSFVDGQ